MSATSRPVVITVDQGVGMPQFEWRQRFTTSRATGQRSRGYPGHFAPDGPPLRRHRLERRLAELAVVQPDDEMISVCAELRQGCRQVGHPLASKIHDGDRWIAAASIHRLGLALVSHDGAFHAAPRLELRTVT